MARSHVGMKVYDNDWYLKYELSYAAAAELLSDWGVTFVIAQSRLLPMPDSAIKSEVPPDLAERYATYEDRKFRDALAARGIKYYASALMFFDPAALRAEPSLEAIGSDGLPMPTIDWYVGIPPTKQRHVANKIRTIERAVRALEPDGIHLGLRAPRASYCPRPINVGSGHAARSRVWSRSRRQRAAPPVRWATALTVSGSRAQSPETMASSADRATARRSSACSSHSHPSADRSVANITVTFRCGSRRGWG